MINADFLDVLSAINITLLLGNIETVISLILLVVQLVFVAYKLVIRFLEKSGNVEEQEKVVDEFIDDVTDLLPGSDDQNNKGE